MRITNKMINNNSLFNINNNKEVMDALNTQMAPQKKINDPSDDPIIAIRSLRFRGSLASITQYLGRNVSDAKSWTDSTQTALDSAVKILEDFKSQYTSGATTTRTDADKKIYLNSMKALSKELFAIGNSTNEDRYIFTGYRTSDSLTFTDNNIDERMVSAVDPDHPFQYKGIAEHFTIDNVESYTYTSYKKGTEYSSGITDGDIIGVAPNATPADETQVKAYSEYRLRLSYDNIDAVKTGTYKYNYPDGAEDEITSYTLTLKNYDPSTNTYSSAGTMSVTAIKNDSEAVFTDDTDTTVYLNTVTGNLIFTAQTQKQLAQVDDIEFAYDKSNWDEGDVKPEHYFCCTEVGDKNNTPIKYNDYLQEMNYSVGTSQSVKVNTNARKAFNLGIIRDLDELEDAFEVAEKANAKVEKLKKMQEDVETYASDDEQEQIRILLGAAEKEVDYATQKINTMFSNGITKSQKYYDEINLAATTCGTTVHRLEVIENRLTENKTTVTAQASDNENADLSTLSVEVSQANLYYNAALMVTGRISQQSLVDYI